jgi:hypothetical protein
VWCVPSRISFPSVAIVAEAELPAQAAQLAQLPPAQRVHFPHEPRHVAGKDGLDQPAPGRGQRDHDKSSIVAPSLLLDQPPAHQVGHHHRGVAIAAEQLGPEIALTERPVVQERLQHAELADRERRLGHDPADPARDRLGRPHELDVGVEHGRLDRAAGIAGRHRLNLNGY